MGYFIDSIQQNNFLAQHRATALSGGVKRNHIQVTI
jgi:hypothetical protein